MWDLNLNYCVELVDYFIVNARSCSSVNQYSDIPAGPHLKRTACQTNGNFKSSNGAPDLACCSWSDVLNARAQGTAGNKS